MTLIDLGFVALEQTTIKGQTHYQIIEWIDGKRIITLSEIARKGDRSQVPTLQADVRRRQAEWRAAGR